MERTPDHAPHGALPPTRTVGLRQSNRVVAKAAARQMDDSMQGVHRPAPPKPPKPAVPQGPAETTLGELSARLKGAVDEVAQPFNPGQFLQSHSAGTPRKIGASLAGAAIGRMKS